MCCRFCKAKLKRDYASCPGCMARQTRLPHCTKRHDWLWLVNLYLTGVITGIWIGYWLIAH